MLIGNGRKEDKMGLCVRIAAFRKLHPRNSRTGCSGEPVESLTVVVAKKQEKKLSSKLINL